MVTIQLPCYVGDVVFCKIDDHKEDYLDECYVKSIEIEKDFPHDGMADPPLYCNVRYTNEKGI